jgi:hypothetical protein
MKNWRGEPKSRCWQLKIQSKAEPTHWVARSPTVTSKTEEYRRRAQECLDAFQSSQDAEERAILFRIAQRWMQLADQQDAAATAAQRAIAVPNDPC